MIEISLSDVEMVLLKAEAAARRMTPEEYVIDLLEKDIANNYA